MPASDLPAPDLYVDALLLDLERTDGLFSTIYIGGGTPTELPAEPLARLVRGLGRRLAPGGEWSVETNPLSLTESKASLLAAAGVTRLSIGFQSASDDVLARLGRAHRHRDNRRALEYARAAGFALLSGDVIFGLPDEAIEETLDFMIAAGLDHVSAYELTIEKDSAWGVCGLDPGLDADAKSAIFDRIIDRLEAAGLKRYEISNFARPGAECRSHLNVWRSGDFIGIGAGAHGHENGIRYSRPRNVAAVIAREAPTEMPVEDLFAETLQLGTRLVNGFAPTEIPPCRRAAMEQAPERLRLLVENGYVRVENGRIIPTDHGLRFQNDLALMAAKAC
jgi:oxygen-independent coproporphyrinogen-3 oxidase